MIHICNSCGRKNSEDNSFCAYCGHTLILDKEGRVKKNGGSSKILAVFIIALLIGYGSVWVYHPYVESVRDESVGLANRMNADNLLTISNLENQLAASNDAFNQLLRGQQSLQEQVSALEANQQLIEKSNEDLLYDKNKLMGEKKILEKQVNDAEGWNASLNEQVTAYKEYEQYYELYNNLQVEYDELETIVLALYVELEACTAGVVRR